MPDAERPIENLILSYAEFVDDGDLEGVAALLADATIGVDGVAAGLGVGRRSSTCCGRRSGCTRTGRRGPST